MVIAQVNAEMPFSGGDSLVHLSEVDYIIEHSEPLVEYGTEELDYETRRIGEHVARLVDDGSTIQIGFGRIPDAALRAMSGKRNLSVHSEIITDTVMDLIRGGEIPDGNTVTTSLCIGPRDSSGSWTAIRESPWPHSPAWATPRPFSQRNPTWPSTVPWRSTSRGSPASPWGNGGHLGTLGQPHFNA